MHPFKGLASMPCFPEQGESWPGVVSATNHNIIPPRGFHLVHTPDGAQRRGQGTGQFDSAL